MTLLELRNKIDKAIAQCGGGTNVEVRNNAGDLDYVEFVMMIPVNTSGKKSIVLDVDDEIASRNNGSVLY